MSKIESSYVPFRLSRDAFPLTEKPVITLPQPGLCLVPLEKVYSRYRTEELQLSNSDRQNVSICANLDPNSFSIYYDSEKNFVLLSKNAICAFERDNFRFSSFVKILRNGDSVSMFFGNLRWYDAAHEITNFPNSIFTIIPLREYEKLNSNSSNWSAYREIDRKPSQFSDIEEFLSARRTPPFTKVIVPTYLSLKLSEFPSIFHFSGRFSFLKLSVATELNSIGAMKGIRLLHPLCTVTLENG